MAPIFYFFLFLESGRQVWLLFHGFLNPPPPISPHLTVPDPTLKRQFRSDPPLLRLRAVEPFHARRYGKKGGGGRGGGWSGGMERREGSLLVGGQGSAFSARKERGNWGERFQMFRRQKAQSRTHTAHVSVSSCTVFKAGRTREANMCVNLGTALL